MIDSMNHITIAVKDINRSFLFYKDLLGLIPIVKWDKGAYFLAGDFWFCLNRDELHKPAIGYTHFAFSVSQENSTWLSKKIIDSGAFIFKNNTSEGDSLYFLDPDGHKLEIHVGDWKSRVTNKKEKTGNWTGVTWYT